MTKILVVEDEDMIRERLVKALGFEGFEVIAAENGAIALQRLEQVVPDLIISDILMPDVGGFDFVTVVRSRPDTRLVPIIIITALSERLSQREFMELGVDDYLTKPFHIEELLRAVKTQLKKRSWWEEEHRDIREAPYLTFSNWRMDVERRSLISTSGVQRSLTNSEAQLLLVFLRNANRVLDRDTLINLLGKPKLGANDRSIDVLIGRLRRKIEVDVKRPKVIETIRSGGYIFNGEVKWMSSEEG